MQYRKMKDGTALLQKPTITQSTFCAILEYAQVTSLKKYSSAMTQCTRCGACEKHCPQHIDIRKELQNAKKTLQPFYIRVLLKLVEKIVK